MVSIRIFPTTVLQRISLPNFSGGVGGHNIYDDLDVDQHVDDPKEKESRKKHVGVLCLIHAHPELLGVTMKP